MPSIRNRLKDDEMYERVLAGDPSSNGQFFFGVTTTGIYCLPSCGARKPLRKNIRFFSTADAARVTGLRPCRKCHPDDFARGADPVLESIEALVAEIRINPAAFPDVRTIARRSGFGLTRLFELFRLHYQATPADVLLRARLKAAQTRLLDSSDGLVTIAADVGFESLSAFHDQFRHHYGLSPKEYRNLRGTKAFTLSLPIGYPLPYLRRMLGRDPGSLTERLEGDVYTAGVRLSTGPALMVMQLSSETVRVEFEWIGGAQAQKNSNPKSLAFEIHTHVIGILGLDQDAPAFSRLAKKLGLERLVAGRAGLRIHQIPNLFEGLLWVILGQQINMSFAFTLRRRLVELTGERLGNKMGKGLYAPPTPTAIAALSEADLLPLQFSRQKAAYVVAVARLIAEDKLDLNSLRGASATRTQRILLAIHGLGSWSVNFLMLRTLGFPDCVPYGDTGVTSGLKALFNLEERPDVAATRRLMGVFAPYRSLATAHLWQFNLPEPT